MFPHIRLEHHRTVFEGEVFDAYRAIDFVDPHRMASAIGAVILPRMPFFPEKSYSGSISSTSFLDFLSFINLALRGCDVPGVDETDYDDIILLVLHVYCQYNPALG